MKQKFIVEHGKVFQYSSILNKYVCIGEHTNINDKEYKAWQENTQTDKKNYCKNIAS